MFNLFNRTSKRATSDLQTGLQPPGGNRIDYERLLRNSLPVSVLSETVERNRVHDFRLRRLQHALDSLGEVDRDFTSTDLKISVRLRAAGGWTDVYPISATLALTARGVPLATAKQTLRQLFDDGAAIVDIPHLDEPRLLLKDLYLNGISTEITSF